MKQNYIFLILSVTLGLIACSDKTEHHQTSISGEIVDPQSPYITISKNGDLIDTVSLNTDNQFYYAFKSVEPGLYTFRHAIANHYETQMFYIEDGDSLRLRVNTQDFDRSLMYSGDGAPENNYLMQIFLDYRKNNKILPHYYQMESGEFKHKIDSIRTSNVSQLKSLKRNHHIGKDYFQLVKSIIDYSYFDFKERYYFLVNKYNQKLKKQLPDDFLTYRDEIDFNDQRLQSYYIYHYLLDDFFENKSIENCQTTSQSSDNCFDLESIENLDYRLKLADSLFKLKTLRTRFLTRFAARRIVQSSTKEGVDSTVDVLKNREFKRSRLEQIENLADIQKRQFIGNIGDLDLMLTSGQTVKISTILNEPSIFYYWSVYYKAHHEHLHKTIDKLRKRYPQLNFIGINIDNDNPKAWHSALENFDYGKNEYQLVCSPRQRGMFQNYLNELVFVDKDGQVIDNNINSQSQQLEQHILELINR